MLENTAERARACAETPMVVRAETGDLVAILTPPDPAAAPAGYCVVHLTRPRSHRNRNWVRGARWLASRGFTACRFDYHGNGDSSGENGPLDPSSPNRADLMAVLRALRARESGTRFILTGNCFDARTALSVVPVEPSWIAGLAFLSAPVMPLSVMDEMRTANSDWGGVWQAVQNRDNWKRMTDPGMWRNVRSRVRGVIGGGSGPAESGGGAGLDPGFLEAFQALAASRARALIVYGAEDKELLTFRPVLERLLPALPAEARERIRVEIWPGQVHDGFNHLDRQQQIVDRVLEWVASFHPAAPAAAVSPNVSASRA
jgi:alpha/beta superfamily hydrolase